MSNKKLLIAYYSRTDNTKKVVEKLAELLKCDTERIIDNKNRKGLIGYIKSGRDSLLKKTTNIAESETNFSNYDVIILATPVWASNITPAIRTYVLKYGHNFEKVAFIFTQMGSGYEKAEISMKKLIGKKPLTSICINSKDIKENKYEDAIIKFINDINC